MKPRYSVLAAISVGLFAAFAQVMNAGAVEIKVSTARLVATVLREVGPQFERETGHQLKVTEIYGPTFIKRIDAGEPFDTDVLILRPDYLDAFIKDGKLVAETRTNIVQTGVGVEVRAGALRPDISSVEAFKRALLNAKSIAYLKNGLESSYIDDLLEKLGIAKAVKLKLTKPETDIVSTLTAKGGSAAVDEVIGVIDNVGVEPCAMAEHFPGQEKATEIEIRQQR
jgi:molybdate transport system substrate-binding protein